MKALKIGMLIGIMVMAPTLYADDSDNNDSACKQVAKACIKAGYSHKDSGKGFWKDCMKPLLMNQTVKNITLPPSVASDCRTNKIKSLQDDLQALQSVVQQPSD